MVSIKKDFARNRLASAVFCSMIGLPCVAVAATMEGVNEENLAVPPVEGKTLVYTDTEGTASFGWLDPINDFGVPGLGIEVYKEPFTAQQKYDFAGCLMAQPDRQLLDPPQTNCTAPPDSGKRFKLKTTETNAPIDLVVDVTADDSAKLYRVIGKFSNLTDASNSVGGDLNAFRFETGFGVGNDFIASSAGDGLSFGFADASTKLTIGDLGKSPGGLFGGSKVEGLPFFSTNVSGFEESEATALDEDTTETTGTMPAPYFNLFEDWRTLSEVPTGWFIDHDGNPANDSILLAYNADTSEAPDWQTYEKVFQDAMDDPSMGWDGNVVYEFDHDDDSNTDPIPVDIPAVNWDPNGASFASSVTVTVDNGDGTDTDYEVSDYVKDVLPLVETLGEGDPGDTQFDAISLVQSAAVDLYDGSFDVLIDGEAVNIASFDAEPDGNPDWADMPPTVAEVIGESDDTSAETDDLTFATYNSDPDPTVDGEDGVYDVAAGYVGNTYTYTDSETSETVSVTVPETLTLDEMAAVIGTGADPVTLTAADESTVTLDRRAGYLQGPIEDLANVNVNTTISVDDTSSWPTCTSDGTETNCTFTLRVTGLNDAVEEPTIPVTPVEPEPEEPTDPDDTASSSDGGGTIFGCTAGKPGSPFDPVLPGLVLMALGGLWARKRLSNA
ncbi:hypothetical protein SAMN04487881_2824 [Marinobacter sp. es.048]|uniref:choice-of-anchor F family protein n=1 Tax=Marinobacter sp. es.048 TaxID=1761795 RepID=UPI000B58E97E|nr:choice-of-anchor F family protein [Marinobacter sp. es.048]SNC75295.1 hypothetical protein SAMN04487881_2824 [Marinobacter sp. es.048]